MGGKVGRGQGRGEGTSRRRGKETKEGEWEGPGGRTGRTDQNNRTDRRTRRSDRTDRTGRTGRTGPDGRGVGGVDGASDIESSDWLLGSGVLRWDGHTICSGGISTTPGRVPRAWSVEDPPVGSAFTGVAFTGVAFTGVAFTGSAFTGSFTGFSGAGCDFTDSGAAAMSPRCFFAGFSPVLLPNGGCWTSMP